MALYDFLYIDQERMQSLYAQLFSGLLSAMETLHGKQEESRNGGQVGGDPFGNLKHENATTVCENSTDHIAPHDIILKDVLDALHEKCLIKDPKSTLEIGNFVLFEGKVSFFDYGIGKNFVNLAPMLMKDEGPELGNVPKGQRKEILRQHKKNQEAGFNFFQQMAEMLPWEVQMVITAGEVDAWAVVDKKKLRESTAGLSLMYGSTLTGKWSILGIVDQLHEEAPHRPNALDGNDLANAVHVAISGINQFVGCPKGCVGITPLLLFRQVG